MSIVASASAAQPKLVRKPGVSKRLPFHGELSGADRKVALHAYDLLWDAAESNDWGPIRDRTRLLLASRVVAGPWEPEAVACLAYCALFAEYVPTLESDDVSDLERREFQRWLLVNPQVTQRFLFALTEADSTPGAVAVLHTLSRRNPRAVEKYPDLAVAAAIVFDHGRTPPHRYCDTLDWLAAGRGSLAYDATAVPHELARYLIDIKVSPAERVWAFNRYRGQAKLDKVYHDVEYDRDALTGKRPKNISGRNYTLMNLQAYGGTCGDQAYFASQVGRILGFPVANIRHSGPGIIGHCWCLQLLPGRDGFYWQEVGGEGFGWIVDPATGREGSDQMLGFLLQSLNRDAAQRDMAAALAQVALRIPDWIRKDVPAGPAELVAQAAPSKRTDDSPTTAPYYKFERTLDPVPVLDAALSLDPFSTSAWLAVESLGQREHLPPDALVAFMARLESLAGVRFPDVLHFAAMNVSERLPPEVAIRLLEGAWKSLTPQQIDRSPKLAGDLLLKVGDLYQQKNRPADALRHYETAIALSVEYVPTVIRAMERALPIVKQSDELPRLVHACELVFEKNENPRFGLDVGRALHEAGFSPRAVLWLRYVYDRTKRDTPGRYDSLRLAVQILAEMHEYSKAAQWGAELYDVTLHPADGHVLVGLFRLMDRHMDADRLLQRVLLIEHQRQQQVSGDALKRAGSP